MSKKSGRKSAHMPHLPDPIAAVSDLPYHVVIIPVVTILLLFFVSIAAVISVNGQSVRPNDLKLIELTFEGTKQIVPTRAQTVGEFLKQQKQIKLGPYDKTIPAQDSAILATGKPFAVSIHKARPVKVIDRGKSKVIVSAADSYRDVVNGAGYKLAPEDNVRVLESNPSNVLREGNGLTAETVVIDRSVLVHINLYGNKIEARTHTGTVGELLAEKGIVPKKGDTITPAQSTRLKQNMSVLIVRVGSNVRTVEEVIPAPIETINDPNLRMGLTEVREEGKDGIRIVTYEITLHNGREASRKELQTTVKVEPQARVIANGTKVVISNPSENVKIGQQMASAVGWTGDQWYCLYSLWQKESGWNHLAYNSYSGAYGIPQALPGSKMGEGWQTDPVVQINWGLGYVRDRYGTPCGAWQHSQSLGWY